MSFAYAIKEGELPDISRATTKARNNMLRKLIAMDDGGYIMVENKKEPKKLESERASFHNLARDLGWRISTRIHEGSLYVWLNGRTAEVDGEGEEETDSDNDTSEDWDGLIS